MVRRVSEDFGNELHTEIDTKIKKKMCQFWDALLPALLNSEIQASLNIAQTNWTALLKGKMAQMMEKIAPTTTNPLLSDGQLSIQRKMFG